MTRRRAALATLTAVGALLLGTAGPAAAAEGPTVTVTSPGDGEVVTDANAAVAGRATTDPLHTVQSVRVTATPVNPRWSNEVRSCDASLTPDGGFSCSPGLSVNDTYNVEVTATDVLLVGLTNPRTGPVATRSFKVAAPPTKPQDVRVDVAPDRRVTISWVRNSEPDLNSYRVTRVAPGGGAPSLVAVVRQPSSGERVSAVDGAVPPTGGSYRYLVTAIRPGATAESESSLEVPAAPTDGAPGAGVPGPGPGTAGGPARRPAGTRGRGGVPSFLSGLGGEQTLPARPDGEVLPAEDGFALPGAEDESGSPDPAVLGTTESASNERALLVPIAAGLLLCVLAFHLRQFDRAVLAAPAAYHPIVDPDGGDVEDGDDDDDDRPGFATAVPDAARRRPRQG
jgi:hypothetical protein